MKRGPRTSECRRQRAPRPKAALEPTVMVSFAQPVSPGTALRTRAFDQLRRVWLEARADGALSVPPPTWHQSWPASMGFLLVDEASCLLDLAASIVYAPTPGPRVRYRTPVPMRPSRSG